jgi:phosphotransferase system enzyme I (PtsI)
MGLKGAEFCSMKEPGIVIAEELTPSDMTKLDPAWVKGIITESGGVTSHTAIISRVMGIPAVVGAQGILSKVNNEDMVIIDGCSGEILIRPDKAVIEAYQSKLLLERQEQEQLQAYIGKKTISKDGYEISIGCNIGSPKDLEAVLRNDGEGIGLFRSEFLYMDRNAMPDEEEQLAAYKAAAEALDGKAVIIRTLDIGGDKELPYMKLPKEDNPFLGYRAIRYCLEEKDMFRTQLRAILRASSFGKVKIMLPMICSVEEVRKARILLQESMRELDSNAYAYDKDIELGIMIETPAAAMISDVLAKEVDFFSIGTNDLTQYTLAVDRMNSRIASLYTPYHPAVLRSIKLIADNAKEAGIEVGMCGEAAQDELLAPVFMGMGLDELSVSPPQVLKIRKLINSLNKKEWEVHAAKLLKLPDPEEIQRYLKAIN